MKKLICILLMAAVLMLAACDNKENNDNTEPESDTTETSDTAEAGTEATTEAEPAPEEAKNVFSMYLPTTLDEKYWGNGTYTFVDIEAVTFLSDLSGMPGDAMDVSAAKDGGVMSWVSTESGKVALYIAAEGGVWFEPSRNGLFSDFQNVESISFNNSVRTDDVTNMFGMFRNLSKLKTVDLSGINTSNVLSMESMFAHCEQLETVDLTGFDTSSVYNMDCMFYDCYALKQIDMSSFDFSNVEYIRSIFEDCKELTDIGCEIVLSEKAQSNFMYENSGLEK